MQFSAASTVGFIGGGHMTNAIVGGLVNGVKNAPSICVSNRGQAKLAALTDKYGVQGAASNEALVESSDVIVLAVKPQVLESVLTPLAEIIQERQPLIISLAAGIHCGAIDSWAGGSLPIIRVMPNTPSLIREGASGLYANDAASESQRDFATQLMAAIGLVVWVEEETQIDLVTAISGSGPAYFMLFIDALVKAASKRGMDEEIAQQLALKTASGTANMLASSDIPLSTQIENMLLPGGTTEQAVAALRQHDIYGMVEGAVEAANRRAKELAEELNKR